MCGIFALLDNSNISPYNNIIQQSFKKGTHRGPDNTVFKNVMLKTYFGFHRLSINGLDDESNQPIKIGNITLICNGEIYNYKELYELIEEEPITNSDCEIIIHLYKYYGIEHTLQLLDGVFAFCLLDTDIGMKTTKMYIARDPYGVRPLYIIKKKKNASIDFEDDKICVASELKVLCDLHSYYNTKKNDYLIEQFKPGTYTKLEQVQKGLHFYWKIVNNYVSYHTTGFNSCTRLKDSITIDSIYKNIHFYLTNAVEKRCCTTDRPIACLLSGGLDSSLITALVNDYFQKNNLGVLETYSIGVEGSEDLKFAKLVADHLGTKHTEIVLQEKDFTDVIPNVIYDIESFDTTTVRASIGNWLIGKYISEHSDAKVIFNGDGSDELTGGYLYVSCAPDSIEFDRECRRLLKYIHTFDVLRSDKCISSHGLESRTPFLDREWVQYYLSIPYHFRCKTREQCEENNETYTEKKLLRDAFNSSNFKNSKGTELLPDCILYRQKEAFSDGVSLQTRSLFEITNDHAKQFIKQTLLKDLEFIAGSEELSVEMLTRYHNAYNNVKGHLEPTTHEQLYYRFLFEKHYNGLGKIIPYFWMPKYINAKDSSARTLTIYKDKPVSRNIDELDDSEIFRIQEVD